MLCPGQHCRSPAEAEGGPRHSFDLCRRSLQNCCAPSFCWSEDTLRPPGRAGLSQAHLQPLRARHLSLLPRRGALADQGCAVRVRDFQIHTLFHRHLTNCVPPRICLLHQHMVYLSHARYRWDPASVQLSNQCKTNHANNLYLRHRSHWAKVPTSLHQLSSKSHQVPMFMSGENQMQ